MLWTTTLPYLILMLVLFIALMKLRKIAITPKKQGPRTHRRTYQQ